MKILGREKISPIYVNPGDSITLEYRNELGEVKTALQQTVMKPLVADEAVVFEAESGDFPGIKEGIGGLFGVAE